MRLHGRARELGLFLLVGGTSAAAYTVLGVFFTAGIGLRPSLAVLLALAIVMPPTYLLQRALTFQSRRAHRSAFLRYLATQAISNGVAVLGAELFAQAIRARPWIAFAAITLLVAMLNYTLLKTWAFSYER